MARKSTGGNRPRTVWSRDLAALVTAARSGASHAARTARQERQQARRKGWWHQRWLYVTAAGLAVAGAAGGVYQTVAKRRRAAPEEAAAGGQEAAGGGQEQAAGTAIGAIRSTVDTGRERVTEAARGMLHRIRREEEPEHPERVPSERVTSPPDGAAGTPDQAPDQTDVTRGAAGQAP